MHAAEKGWSLDAQICEQQGGKREAWLNTGYGADLRFGYLREQDYVKQVIKKLKKIKKKKKRDTRKPEGGYRQEQAPKVC